jgi:hypothetical protein
MRLTLNNWLSGMRLTHPSVCGRTDFFWEYQYSDRYKGVEDADLWFRSCRENKLIILPNFMIFYRDPLQLKLSTYCFRQKQARQSRLNYYKEGKLSFKFVVKLLFRSYLREIIYGLSSLFGWDNKLLSRRNQAISKLDKERFEHLLHHIIITNTH